MHLQDADLFEQILLRQLQQATLPFTVLEWGSGRSTCYFANRLRETGKPFRWVSLEYDREFFETRIRPELPTNLRVSVTYIQGGRVEKHEPSKTDGAGELEMVVFNYGTLAPFVESRKADRTLNMDDYINYPAQLNTHFDFVLVDGRKRRRCLGTASKLLKPNGVALLHDAQREYYADGFKHYRSHKRIGTILWIGSQTQTDFSAWLD